MWEKFNPDTAEDGIYWFFGERTVYDVDVDMEGRTVGKPTGETEPFVALAEFWRDFEGEYAFHQIQHPDTDTFNIGEGDFPSFCLRVDAPKAPSNEVLSAD